MVVGHSQTGEMDKIDGPYYFFTLIKKLREMLPPWMPTLGIEGGRINIVPVDFVADAMDHIAHKPKLDGHTFRSEEHTSELQSLMRNSYAVFCLKKKHIKQQQIKTTMAKQKHK